MSGSGLLLLVGVCRDFRRGRRRLRVLVDVSLEVGVGEIVAVLGSRGEGKTTLLEVAAGIAVPDAGDVWFEGVDLRGCSAQERSDLLGDRVAWIHRGGPGVKLSVLDYVELPLRMGRKCGDPAARAMEALERVGAVSCARQQWEDLSNWERVLVEFARGIVSRPRLMLIDDVMDGLGMRRTRQAGELLCSLVEDYGFGVLMSVSDLEAALIADRVLSFEHGGLTSMSDPNPHHTNIIPMSNGTFRASGGGRL
jgi:ABC-type lipoprotein export system ATPase subunit